MENSLWKIDRKPALHEEGEISDEEAEDQFIVPCKNSPKEENDLEIQDQIREPNNSSDFHEISDGTANSVARINNNQFNKGVKSRKKLAKKKQKFDYSNLSDAEFNERFRQVSQQIQMLDANEQQAFNDQQMHNHLFNMQENQFNHHMNPHFNQNHLGNAYFNDGYLDNNQHNNNQTQDRPSPNHQNRSFNRKSNNKSNNQASSTFNQQSLKPGDRVKLNKMLIAMSNILFGAKSRNKRNLNKKSVINKNNNQTNSNNLIDKKRKFKDKNNANKRPNKGANNQKNCYNQSFTGNEAHMNGDENQLINNTFSPVITSDLFPSPNRNRSQMAKNKSNSKPNGNQICRYYLAGNCNKGNKCEFIHSNDKRMKINELCKFYVQSACDKKSCVYLHEEFPCKFYHTGAQCFDGENCKFSHKPLTEDMSLALKQFLTPKEKKIDISKKDRVLLGTPTTEMRHSYSTWQWQQELRQLETTHSGEDENFFKISNEFIIKDQPLVNDLTFKTKIYSVNEHTEQLINELEVTKQSNLNGTKYQIEKPIKNDVVNSNFDMSNTHYYHRREHLINKEINGSPNSLNGKRFDNMQINKINMSNTNSSYVSKIARIIENNRMSKLYNSTCAPSSLNTSLYGTDRQSNTANSESDLINKLAQETKIDDLAQQSEVDKFAEFKSNLMTHKNHISPVKNFVEQTSINPNEIAKPRSLLDEIMNNEGFVGGSISLAKFTPTKPNEPLPFPKQINQYPLESSLSSFELTSFSQSNFKLTDSSIYKSESNTTLLCNSSSGEKFKLKNENIDLNLNLNSDLDPEYIVSKSPDEDFEFKLYYGEKSKLTYFEYEIFHQFDENGRNDPRLIKFFSPSSIMKKPTKFDLFEQLDLLVEKHESKNAMCSLSELSNMRKKRTGSESKDETG